MKRTAQRMISEGCQRELNQRCLQAWLGRDINIRMDMIIWNYLIASEVKLLLSLSLFQYTALVLLFPTSQMSLCFHLTGEAKPPEVKELEWISEKAASSCSIPKTGVLCASSRLMGWCCREVSWRVRPLISDLRAFMASGWVSKKPRNQKAAGPALHWKEKHKLSSNYK